MLDAIKSANIANNILILIDLFYLEGVVAHGRASSSLAFTSSQQGPQSFSIAGLFFVPSNRAWSTTAPKESLAGSISGNGRGGDETSVPGGRFLGKPFRFRRKECTV